MALTRVEVVDVRSVGPRPIWLDLGAAATVLVGPNHSGKSNVARGVVAALDPEQPFDVSRDWPVGRPDALPTVTLHFDHRPPMTVVWRRSGDRSVTGVDALRADSVVYCGASEQPTDVVARHLRSSPGDVDELMAGFAQVARRIIPDIGEAIWIDSQLIVKDQLGLVVDDVAGLRGAAVVAVADLRVSRGEMPELVLVDQPEVYLHPAAQESARDEFDRVAKDHGVPVLITTESPFIISRSPAARIVAVGRDDHGHTRVIGSAWGNEPHAPILGGLFRDPGLAAILDRMLSLPPGTEGVVIFEGGTDEAYLRLAADRLGRSDVLKRIAIAASGGASAAALKAIVLRAETDIPILAIFDNDDPGLRGKRTLTDRFSFKNRKQAMTYAEVVANHPAGAEAEDVFRWTLVERFVEEFGEHGIRGKRILTEDIWHFDLTSEAKSAFVGWLEENVEVSDLAAWDTLLDLIVERLEL